MWATAPSKRPSGRLRKTVGLRSGRIHTPSRVGETNTKNRRHTWARQAGSERGRAPQGDEGLNYSLQSKW